MYVHPAHEPTATPIPGVEHATWAAQAEGLSQLSLWRQRLAPGGATPPHRHDCDELVLCQSGEGELHIDGQVHRFTAGQVVTLPRNVMHQLFNVGRVPMEIVAVLAATPVEVFLPGDEPLALPWRS